jgi:hypothetical protein
VTRVGGRAAPPGTVDESGDGAVIRPKTPAACDASFRRRPSRRPVRKRAVPPSSDPLAVLCADVARALLPNTDAAAFRPDREWLDFGLLIDAMEARGLYLMTNSATKDGRVRRTASFHRVTGLGYPCVGSSEWGYFATHGEAALRAAHEALLKPRA